MSILFVLLVLVFWVITLLFCGPLEYKMPKKLHKTELPESHCYMVRAHVHEECYGRVAISSQKMVIPKLPPKFNEAHDEMLTNLECAPSEKREEETKH